MDVEFSQTSQLADIVASHQVASNRLSEDVALKEQETEVSNSTNASNTNADTQDSSDEPVAQEIESAVGEISEFVQAQNRNLNFSYTEESNRSVVKVTDSETGDLIRQIPSEEVLKLSERIRDLQSDVGAAVGVLFNKEV